MSVARKVLLAASTNAWLRERATRAPFVRRSVSKFMPGERLEDAMRAAADQQRQRIGAILTRLGENLTRLDAAGEVTEHYLHALDRVQAAGLDAQISIKPTQLGLDLDRDVCFRNLVRLVDRAEQCGNIVWIDMESSKYVDSTLDLFRRARERSARVGIALQAYLRRTPQDLDALLPLGCTIRLVKGAYLEPPSIAYPRKSDVDEHYHELACRILTAAAESCRSTPGQSPSRAGATCLHIATHDSRLIDRLKTFIWEKRIPDAAYEYAMLYGIQRALQQKLSSQGRRVRVLISYGEYWFPWYMRRLAERPANIWFVAKNLVG